MLRILRYLWRAPATCAAPSPSSAQEFEPGPEPQCLNKIAISNSPYPPAPWKALPGTGYGYVDPWPFDVGGAQVQTASITFAGSAASVIMSADQTRTPQG